jgi:hypothetical protein
LISVTRLPGSIGCALPVVERLWMKVPKVSGRPYPAKMVVWARPSSKFSVGLIVAATAQMKGAGF